MFARQLDLLGGTDVAFDPGFEGAVRCDLGDGAWVEHVPGWLRGRDRLFDQLATTTTWRTHRRRMYDREVDVPRLVADLPGDGPGDPILSEAARALSRRYGAELRRLHLAFYRQGSDSVAWHGDRVGQQRHHTVVAVLSLGGQRRFLLRPKPLAARQGRGPSRRFDVRSGDLLVMGGTCQRTWEHCVPKMARAEPRIAVMFREAT